MVANTADLMEAKAEELELIAQQFDAKGNAKGAKHWRKDIPRIAEAIKLIRERAGCWT